MEYVLDSGKWTYIVILLILGCISFFVADIKFKIYKFDMIQKLFGLTDNQCKFIAAIFIIAGLWLILNLYGEFISLKTTPNQIMLKYLKPRPSVMIFNNLIERYEVRIPKVKENRGIIIYFTNGKKYKSTYVGPEGRDVFDKLTKQLDVLVRKNNAVRTQ